MNRSRRCLAIAIALSAWTASPATAAPITWSISGTMGNGDRGDLPAL
jgi:hypothetical protein